MSPFTCDELDKTLRAGNSEQLEAARVHAQSCEYCRRELDDWESIGRAAKELRREWDSPGLWHRIQESLSAEMQPKASFWQVWRFAFGGAAVVLLAISLFWSVKLRPERSNDQHFLTELALKEVEDSEAAYVRSIERLSKVAKPLMDQPASPLLDSYREKLVLLDSAISELRKDTERNSLNAQLRFELVNLYRQKQTTLTEVLQHANDSTGAR